MAGEGSMMGAIQSLRNNNALRKNDRNKWKEISHSNSEPIEDYIKSTPEQLEAIRRRLQNENKKRKKQQIALMLLFILLLCSVLYFLNQL